MSLHAELWVCQLGARSSTARRSRCRSASAPRARRTRSPTRCCCSSTRRSTRAGGARRRASCRWARTGTASQGIDIVDVDRGGKLTYHGPGQLVGYPIMRDRRRHRLPAHDGAARSSRRSPRRASRPRPPATGPTTPACGSASARSRSIGVHVARGVTTHGFAINVDNDLQPFEWVVPCGLDGVQMTSLTEETGRRGHAATASAGAWRSRSPTALGRRQRLVTPGAGCEAAAPGTPQPERDASSLRSMTHVHHAIPRQPRRDGRAARCLGPDGRAASARKPPWFKVPAPGGPTLPRAAELISRRTCTRSARRRRARTSASAGSAAPRRS